MKYCMNREPLEFKNKRFLVDGCHWPVECSASFNFMEYKKFTSKDSDGSMNSQGRDFKH